MPVNTVGIQLDNEYRISRFMKYTTQRSRVTVVRPSLNSCRIGEPDRATSFVTYSVDGPTRIDGSSFVSQWPSRSSRVRRTARNCSDSGRLKYIATATTSGTAPPTKKTERQPKS